ncbi:helix-turn-helix domain-containing protein [Bilophila wadsworthia]|uniref:helix-turn-helix domain-containing protein n=1 Tax=Bilophila wadsworthia TaxID=35833 RepID=UPI001D1BF893|nr:helix-turn-helix domain-containing protein [Bilophila wadsworthia]
MAIDVLTRMREAIGGARMKELGAWLGVNQSALSDRIRRNIMPIRRLRLFEAGTVTIHLGS